MHDTFKNHFMMKLQNRTLVIMTGSECEASKLLFWLFSGALADAGQILDYLMICISLIQNVGLEQFET